MPLPVSVNVVPETVAGPDTTEKLTGHPEPAVALSVIGGSLPLSAPNVIDWFAFATVNV